MDRCICIYIEGSYWYCGHSRPNRSARSDTDHFGTGVSRDEGRMRRCGSRRGSDIRSRFALGLVLLRRLGTGRCGRTDHAAGNESGDGCRTQRSPQRCEAIWQKQTKKQRRIRCAGRSQRRTVCGFRQCDVLQLRVAALSAGGRLIEKQAELQLCWAPFAELEFALSLQ